MRKLVFPIALDLIFPLGARFLRFLSHSTRILVISFREFYDLSAAASTPLYGDDGEGQRKDLQSISSPVNVDESVIK
jgi:hypothetical protein